MGTDNKEESEELKNLPCIQYSGRGREKTYVPLTELVVVSVNREGPLRAVPEAGSQGGELTNCRKFNNLGIT